MTVKVLFVCLGNICRSPTAEGIFKSKVREAGLDEYIETDSCGTAPFHIGKSPDARAVTAASHFGYDISDLVARQVAEEDFVNFDYIIPMDRKNLSTLQGWAPAGFRGELSLFMSYCDNLGVTQVPDPYHENAEQFEKVLKLIEKAANGLLDHIVEKHDLSKA
jgi:protein-tyrosine phosphatase